MNESRPAVKVGIFVLVGLVLTGALLVKFSKSGALFTPTFTIELVTRNVAGLKPGASVLMAGVPVGTVEAADLSQDGRTVIIQLKLLKKYQDKMHRDARFLVEQAGFLGDQYIAIVPGENREPVVQDGEKIQGEDAFNFQEIARSASGLMQRVDQTVGKLNEAVTRIDQLLLSEETLTNLSTAVLNFRILSDRTLLALDTVDRLLTTNAPAVTASVSNLVTFSRELRDVSGELRMLIVTNRTQLTASISNIETATIQVNQLLQGLQEGRGLAGALLSSPELQQNVSMLTSNLNVASSNLNRFGLWRFLWKPRER
ncbi:MAG: MlaD family protein [Verrucomicrobiales bacterium]|nr:MlaD family protein [Verrucomicrobiales bacterium]